MPGIGMSLERTEACCVNLPAAVVGNAFTIGEARRNQFH